MGWPFGDDLPRTSSDIPRIDGDAGALRQCATDLRSLAGDLEMPRTAAGQLQSITDGTTWQGDAFNAFRDKVEKNPSVADVENAQSIMHQAADVLTTLAGQTSECQSRIDWCRQRIDDLNLSDGDIPEDKKPTVLAIKRDADTARSSFEGYMRAAGNRFGDMTGKTVYAEPPPGFLDRVAGWAGDYANFWKEFAIGIVEGVWEMVKGLYSLVALAVQPWKWDEAWATFTQIVKFAWNNPGDFFKMMGKALVDWDTLMENPGRWLGKLVPAILLAVATGGAGGAASALGRVATMASRFGRLSRVASTATRAASAARRVDNFANIPRRLATSGPRSVQAAMGAMDAVTSLPGRAAGAAFRAVTGRNSGHTPVGNGVELPETGSNNLGGGNDGNEGGQGPETGAGPEPVEMGNDGGAGPEPVEMGDDGGAGPETGSEGADPETVETGHDGGGNDTSTGGSETSDPVGTETSDPVGNDTSDPAATTTSDPAATTTSDPAGTTAGGPETTNTSDPAGTTTGGPETTNTSDPAGGNAGNPDTQSAGHDGGNAGNPDTQSAGHDGANGSGSRPTGVGDPGSSGAANPGGPEHRQVDNPADLLRHPEFRPDTSGIDAPEFRPDFAPADLANAPDFRPDPIEVRAPDARTPGDDGLDLGDVADDAPVPVGVGAPHVPTARHGGGPGRDRPGHDGPGRRGDGRDAGGSGPRERRPENKPDIHSGRGSGQGPTGPGGPRNPNLPGTGDADGPGRVVSRPAGGDSGEPHGPSSRPGGDPSGLPDPDGPDPTAGNADRDADGGDPNEPKAQSDQDGADESDNGDPGEQDGPSDRDGDSQAEGDGDPGRSDAGGDDPGPRRDTSDPLTNPARNDFPELPRHLDSGDVNRGRPGNDPRGWREQDVNRPEDRSGRGDDFDPDIFDEPFEAIDGSVERPSDWFEGGDSPSTRGEFGGDPYVGGAHADGPDVPSDRNHDDPSDDTGESGDRGAGGDDTHGDPGEQDGPSARDGGSKAEGAGDPGRSDAGGDDAGPPRGPDDPDTPVRGGDGPNQPFRRPDGSEWDVRKGGPDWGGSADPSPDAPKGPREWDLSDPKNRPEPELPAERPGGEGPDGPDGPPERGSDEGGGVDTDDPGGPDPLEELWKRRPLEVRPYPPTPRRIDDMFAKSQHPRDRWSDGRSHDDREPGGGDPPDGSDGPPDGPVDAGDLGEPVPTDTPHPQPHIRDGEVDAEVKSPPTRPPYRRYPPNPRPDIDDGHGGTDDKRTRPLPDAYDPNLQDPPAGLPDADKVPPEPSIEDDPNFYDRWGTEPEVRGSDASVDWNDTEDKPTGVPDDWPDKHGSDAPGSSDRGTEGEGPSDSGDPSAQDGNDPPSDEGEPPEGAGSGGGDTTDPPKGPRGSGGSNAAGNGDPGRSDAGGDDAGPPRASDDPGTSAGGGDGPDQQFRRPDGGEWDASKDRRDWGAPDPVDLRAPKDPRGWDVSDPKNGPEGERPDVAPDPFDHDPPSKTIPEDLGSSDGSSDGSPGSGRSEGNDGSGGDDADGDAGDPTDLAHAPGLRPEPVEVGVPGGGPARPSPSAHSSGGPGSDRPGHDAPDRRGSGRDAGGGAGGGQGPSGPRRSDPQGSPGDGHGSSDPNGPSSRDGNEGPDPSGPDGDDDVPWYERGDWATGADGHDGADADPGRSDGPSDRDGTDPPGRDGRPDRAGDDDERRQPRSDRERELQERANRAESSRRRTTDPGEGEHVEHVRPGAKPSYVVEFREGGEVTGRGLWKPEWGDGGTWESVPPGGQPAREVATARTAEDLGWDDLTPSTTHWDAPDAPDEPGGPGSLQEWVSPSTPGRHPSEYSRVDRERMAVLDYLTGALDRQEWRTRSDGGPLGWDNGGTFPMPQAPTADGRGTIDYPEPIVSPFVAHHVREGQPLSDEVMDRLRSIDPETIRQNRRRDGIEPEAVDEFMKRFDEILRNGRITGEAWGGDILDSYDIDPGPSDQP